MSKELRILKLKCNASELSAIEELESKLKEAEEQNKELAINFAEWIRVKGWKPDGLRTWTRKIADKPLEIKNTNKLYQEFLNRQDNE